MRTRAHRRRARSGVAVIEVALLMPWVVFLFIGAFDFGFAAEALITTQNAARAAALYTSTSSATAADATTACGYAIEALRSNPNVNTAVTTCTALPVTITAQSITGVDGQPATRVRVTYQSMMLLPIPGIFGGQFTVTRQVDMRLRS
jgi:Flp pilus assembly protein TadG